MANKKISQLNAAAALDGSELVPVVQNATTQKTTVEDIANYVVGGQDTQIIFNKLDLLSGSVNFKYNYSVNSLQQGTGVAATGQYSHAEGYQTVASGSWSHAEGTLTQALGSYSHAEGNITQAIGNYSHAEGGQTETGTKNAYYAQSVVNGVVTLSGSYGNVTSRFNIDDVLYLYDVIYDNNYNRAIFIISQSYYSGSSNTVIELYDTSVNTSAANVVSANLFDWTGNRTIPGDHAHTEGYQTQAIGEYSHAEGQQTVAIGKYSHAEGRDTRATGETSHAEGYQTQAIGIQSHAEGYNVQAIGDASHAEGYYTIAADNYQHVQGKFNATSSVQAAFIVGNGSSDLNRSNLIHAAGTTVEITGSLTIAATVAGLVIPTSEPSSPLTGSIYFNTLTNELNIWNGSWVSIF